MISETTILGIDVSRDWLDGFCLPSQKWFRHPDTADVAVENRALKQRCETAGTLGGGVQEWPSEDKNDV
ncbi:hypothetical protein [Aquicoccus porphyridii]|uniref:hypothetical protein n=1 Tax=Aquicoccus porphyridii TaxID=1852029 RepID=UPI00273F3B46|nr:hypothetical protein [Aquicoccus porphyridii]